MSEMRSMRSSGPDSGKKRKFGVFFKVILPPTLEDNQMGFPPKFVRKYGHELSDSASLTLPDGQVWHLGVTKRKKEIVLDKLWPKFVKHYSITDGHFLVFEYKGMSCFDVNIYDTTCCEIQYPGCDGDIHNEEHRGQEKPSHRNTRRNKGECIMAIKPTKLASASQQSRRAIEKAEKYEAQNPSFMVLLSKYGKYQIYVPTKFAEKYLSGVGDRDKIQIYGSNGGEWQLQFSRREGKYRAYFMNVGRSEFTWENDLGIGDVLVFEVVNGEDAALKMTIFHADENKFG
ncbi:hypothetical protein Tsubulata_011089 [Turnera subulata]|uniref:TF-B3 domain-containing protein n=1 Tax=Turnera subulata TaxID=218843 RepID=A0A9Q0FBS6_9ROSI|nr:hypothetical protein Tsubulata_011089 [Turnera subulata]